VSGFASNPDSWFFIPKIKGQCEELVKTLNFDNLIIYRPGLLRCQRNEHRFLESMAVSFSNWLDFKNWWSISTDDLAKVIVLKSVQRLKLPIYIFEHSEIIQYLLEY
jgi:hypothetical protein